MNDTPTTTTRPETVSIRLRLTPREAARLETVRGFLGLPSLSATAARLALWNADVLAASLRIWPDKELNPRAVMRAAILEGSK